MDKRRKKEYICPYDFDLGCKRVESSYKGNPLLCALRELFSQEWKGDKVIFIGDEINHTKKVYYESDAVKVFYPDNTECKFTDPLPLLMCYGNSVDIGPWVGDIIGVSDEKIDGYTFLKEVHIGW